MNKIDFERAALLMDMQQKVANVSPMNTGILAEANFELKEIEGAARENQRERAEEFRAKEAEAQAERDEKQRAHQEELNRNAQDVKPVGPRAQPVMPGEPVDRVPEDEVNTDEDNDGVADEDEVLVDDAPARPPFPAGDPRNPRTPPRRA